MTVEYSKDMETWTKVSTDKAVFGEDIQWEPGHTEIVYFRVTNDGSLALRYDLSTVVGSYGNGKNAQGKTFALYNYLMFGSADADAAFGTRDDAIAAVKANERLLGTRDIAVKKNEVVLPGKTSVVSALVLYMPTTVGNEANNANPNDSYIPYIQVGVTVNATQATVENDSFGNNYDAGAPTRFTEVSISGRTYTLTENVHAYSQWGTVANGFGGKIIIDADVHAVAQDNSAVAVWATGFKPGDMITINGGTFTQDKPGNDSHYDFIYASDNGQIVINGGTFKAATPEWTLNCEDHTSSTITVKGGTFYKFDPSNANVGAGEIIVSDEFTVVQNGDWYTVVAK